MISRNNEELCARFSGEFCQLFSHCAETRFVRVVDQIARNDKKVWSVVFDNPLNSLPLTVIEVPTVIMQVGKMRDLRGHGRAFQNLRCCLNFSTCRLRYATALCRSSGSLSPPFGPSSEVEMPRLVGLSDARLSHS